MWALDLQGHGRSEGVRGYVERYDIYVEDTATFLAQTAPAPKTFLYGHSMGASTALRLAELYPERVDGLVLTGTTLQAGEFVPAWMIAAASVLSASTPRLRLVAIPAGELSHDPAVNAGYDSDPLVFRGKFTARLGAEILRINAHLLKHVGEIATPMLIMHGAEDRITNVNGARALYECAGAPDKTLKIWEGMYHEIHNEPAVKDAVIAMIGDWMEARL